MRKSGPEWPEVGHFGDLDVVKVPREMPLFATAFATKGRDTNVLNYVARRNLIRWEPGVPQ